MLMQNQEVQRHATRTNRLESDFMAQARGRGRVCHCVPIFI
jgi:hypothetical protein